jgi:hypothetical protein
MPKVYNVLIMGASYGSLLGIKLALAGHTVKLACLPDEAALINREGARVRMPVRGREGLVEVDSRQLPGVLSADAPPAIAVAGFDLVALAMQEPQYRSPAVRNLLDTVAREKLPCMSIMNMPPLPYLARIPGIASRPCRDAYTDATVWDGFETRHMTLCSPDPQAFRPPDAPGNVLQVRLPTNFKAARFPSDQHTAMLREIEAGIDAARLDVGGESVELPVKLKVHDSIFVPLAKWAMLIAGNYRCITKDGMRSISDAVHTDLEASRTIYNWVVDLCRSLGATEQDMVPFEKYAVAAKGLTTPSSAARALNGGALAIERVDRLVQIIGGQRGISNASLDAIVDLVDARLASNRRRAA